jgi:hypothetical protein
LFFARRSIVAVLISPAIATHLAALPLRHSDKAKLSFEINSARWERFVRTGVEIAGRAGCFQADDLSRWHAAALSRSETPGKLLIYLGRYSADFSEGALMQKANRSVLQAVSHDPHLRSPSSHRSLEQTADYRNRLDKSYRR